MARTFAIAAALFFLLSPLFAADHPGRSEPGNVEAAAPESMDFWVNSPVILADSILFYYQGYARKVVIAGDFTGWKPELLMSLKNTNFWHFSFEERLPKGTYRYKLQIDDIWTEDPGNTNFQLDESGQKVSVFTLQDDFIPHAKYPLWLKDDLWVFRFEDRKARQISLVGNFNNWSPYSHPMQDLGAGEFELKVRLKPGLCLYAFVRDGQWMPDYNNLHQYTEGAGILVSAVFVRTPEERKKYEQEQKKKKKNTH